MSDDARARRVHEELARFPAELFQFDERIRDGWLSDRYFVRTERTLRHAGLDPVATLQFFGKKDGIVAGLFECVRMLQTQLRPGYDHRELEVRMLEDGDRVEPWEVAFRIHGRYRGFAHLETTLDGVLARRSLIATNARRAAEAAGDVPVIYFAPRHDDWRIQTPDGYAARVGGGRGVSSDAGGSWWGGEGVGTMPHALIAACGGDVVEATLAFARYVRDEEPDVPIVSLVDYRNDCVGDALAVARAMREEFGDEVLYGVRVDTSNRLVDRSLIADADLWGKEDLHGVNPWLVRKLRAALDAEGFDYVGIMVSGGFTPRKIRRFAELGLPIAAYGVGSSILGHGAEADGIVTDFDITADIVEVDGRPQAKVGRARWDNPRLVPVDWDRLADLDARRNDAARS
ncbi:MAG: quinolinate phosphoribosyl transferase [Gemmatimonadota bacterium]|nr:quinolinate phosphoribosyl transferase [Gemmatimonadota bacterium]